MFVSARCDCGAQVEVVPREDASSETCMFCGRPVNVTVGPSAEHPQSPAGFAMSERLGPSDRKSVERQLDGLVANILRSAQTLEGKLNNDERQRILAAMERAQRARSDGDIEEMKARLVDMEKAATLIGAALLRS